MKLLENKSEIFRPLDVRGLTPLFRERPSMDLDYLCFEGVDGFGCYVHVEAVRMMARWGLAARGEEIIGRLGGRFCEDGLGGYTIVQRAIYNDHATGGPVHVVADVDAQEAGRRKFEQECRVLDCVGWWHTHPSGSLFYSSTDRENQAMWTNPRAVGLVLDPKLRHEGLKVFQGPDSRELRQLGWEETSRFLRSRQLGNERCDNQVNPEQSEPRPKNASNNVVVLSLLLAIAALALAVAMFLEVEWQLRF